MREWPLIIATLSSSLLFAISFSAWNYSVTIAPAAYITILIITGCIFVFHYWSSSKLADLVLNFRSSLPARPALTFIFFSIFSALATLTDLEIFWILSLISGLAMLIAIDTVYANSEKSYTIRYHNGQVFLTGLLLTSFMISEPFPFIFISFIKTLYLVVFKIFRHGRGIQKVFSLVYIFYLVFVSYSLFSSISDIHFMKILTLLMIFELGMRFIFYSDFNIARNNFKFSDEKNRE